MLGSNFIFYFFYMVKVVYGLTYISFTARTKEHKKNGFIKILGGCLIEKSTLIRCLEKIHNQLLITN